MAKWVQTIRPVDSPAPALTVHREGRTPAGRLQGLSTGRKLAGSHRGRIEIIDGVRRRRRATCPDSHAQSASRRDIRGTVARRCRRRNSSLPAFGPLLRPAGRFMIVASALRTTEPGIRPAQVLRQPDDDAERRRRGDAPLRRPGGHRAEPGGRPEPINVSSKIGKVVAARVFARDRAEVARPLSLTADWRTSNARRRKFGRGPSRPGKKRASESIGQPRACRGASPPRALKRFSLDGT